MSVKGEYNDKTQQNTRGGLVLISDSRRSVSRAAWEDITLTLLLVEKRVEKKGV